MGASLTRVCSSTALAAFSPLLFHSVFSWWLSAGRAPACSAPTHRPCRPRSPVANCHCSTEHNLAFEVVRPRRKRRWQSQSRCCACGQLLVQTWREEPSRSYYVVVAVFLFRLLLLEHLADPRPSRLRRLVCTSRHLKHDSNRMCVRERLLGRFSCCDANSPSADRDQTARSAGASQDFAYHPPDISRDTIRNIFQASSALFEQSCPLQHLLTASSTSSVVNIQEDKQSYSAESPLLDLV